MRGLMRAWRCGLAWWAAGWRFRPGAKCWPGRESLSLPHPSSAAAPLVDAGSNFLGKNSGQAPLYHFLWRPTMDNRYKSLLGIKPPLTPKKISRLLFSFSIPRRFRGDREVLMTLLDQQATFEDIERASAMYHQAFSPTAGRKTTMSYAHRRLALKRFPNRLPQRRIKPRSPSGQGQH